MKVQPQTDLPERFSPGSVLLIRDEPVTVVSSRSHKAGLVVKLSSIQDRTAAESLRGALLTIPEDKLPSLPEGSYYHFQLIELDVYTNDDEHLGQIVEILETPGNDVYIVRLPERRDILLPAISNVVLDIDLDAARMTVNLMDGLRP